MKSLLKSSYKSLEGQSVIGLLIAGSGALFLFITGDNSLPEIPVEQLLSVADSVSDIKEAYQTDEAIMGATGFAKISATLFFMYKVYNKFLGKRTELKKEEIKQNAKIEDVIVPVNDPSVANLGPNSSVK